MEILTYYTKKKKSCLYGERVIGLESHSPFQCSFYLPLALLYIYIDTIFYYIPLKFTKLKIIR